MSEELVLKGQVGAQFALDGAQLPVRIGKTGELVNGMIHGQYYETCSRGNVYYAANSAAQAVSVALATTYTGLCLANPANSGYNLSILKIGAAVTVAPAGIASLHIIGAYSATAVTHTTPLVPAQLLLGGGRTPVGKADSAATIPTPVYIMPLMTGNTAAALPAATFNIIDIGGALIVPPSAFICIGALTAATGFFGLWWEEVPA